MLRVQPISTASGAATRYVPLVMLTRVMAGVRFLVVAWLLEKARGDNGRVVYGAYQLALEMINWAVPVVMLGMADVAERYAAQFEGEGRLAEFLKRYGGRVLMMGGGLAALAAAGAPMIGGAIFGDVSGAWPAGLIMLVAANVLVLGLYQWTAAALRGVRAYSAAAGLEIFAAVGLLALSCVAALGGSAALLLGAYAVSNALPLAWYATALAGYARGHAAGGKKETAWPKLDRFAAWSVVRLLMMMTFGLVAISGVQWLSAAGGAGNIAKELVAEFAMPYRIAQLLGFVAVTLWASNYAIATRAWAHGGRRRARLTLLRTARLGGALLLFSAGAGLFLMDMVEMVLPENYRAAFSLMFPAMLAMFLWYGLSAFYTVMGDLEERPWRGAAMWMIIVGVQLAVMLTGKFALHWLAQQAALWGSCAGVGAGALVIGPAIFWRPAKLSAPAVPLGIFAIVPLTFLSPWGLAWWIGVPAAAGALLFLWGAGILIRPRDRRAVRRMRAKRLREHAALEAGA